VAAGTQLINAGQQSNKTNRNHSSQQQLVGSSQALEEQIPDLVQALRGFQKSRDSATAQLKLINASQELSLINASQDFIQVPLYFDLGDFFSGKFGRNSNPCDAGIL
jgi:hypothetical protein